MKSNSKGWRTRSYFVASLVIFTAALLSPTSAIAGDADAQGPSHSETSPGPLGLTTPPAPLPMRADPANVVAFRYSQGGQSTPVASSGTTIPGGGTWVELGPKPIDNSLGVFTWGTAPFSGRVTAIAVNASNPSNIYAGAGLGGIWKSIDSGATWRPISDFQVSLAIGSLTISPDGKVLYAGTGEPNRSDSYSGGGILKSTDGGRSWSVLGSSVFTNSSISTILIDPSNPNRVLASTSRGEFAKTFYYQQNPNGVGIFLSLDGGFTWSRTLASQDYYGVADMVVDPANPGVFWAGDFQGSTWRSSDSGATWSQSLRYTQASLQGRVVLAMSPASGSTLIVGFADETGALIGLFRYQYPNPQAVPLNEPPNGFTAGQEKYDLCALGSGGAQCNYDFVLAVDPSNANIIYAGGIELYRSSDGGQTWVDLGGYSANSAIHPDTHALAFLPGTPSTIFVGNDGGIWKSTDRGTTWVNLNSGLGITQFWTVAASPTSSAIIGGTQDNGCPRYSSSTTWSQLVVGDGGWTGFEATNPSILYCSYTNLNFQKSVDGGTTWRLATTGLNSSDPSQFIAPVAQDLKKPGTLYIGSNRIYRTTNFASSWVDISGRLSTKTITAIAIAPSNSNVLYAGDSIGVVRVSQDGGATWQLVANPGNAITSLAVDPTNPLSVYFASVDVGVPRATLQSGVWQVTRLAAPPSSVNVIRILSQRGWLYAGTDQGVYYSIDGGSSWAVAGLSLPNVPVFDIAFTNSNLLLAGTHGRGIWALATGTVPVSLSLQPSAGSARLFSANFFTVTYTSNGAQTSAQQSGVNPLLLNVDPLTSLVISGSSSGSRSPERWCLNIACTSVSFNSGPSGGGVTYYYYDLLSVTFSFASTGGSPPTMKYDTAPSVEGNSDQPSTGTASVTASGSAIYVLRGGSWSMTNPLSGSTTAERWFTSTPTGSISDTNARTIAYYHQFFVRMGYSILGGGAAFQPPLANYTALGGRASTVGNSSTWVDAGTAYYFPSTLRGSTVSERWVGGSRLNGMVGTASNVVVKYQHQYFVTVARSPAAGGNVSPSDWFNSSLRATISATANQGWKLDNWSGSGEGSFSGNSTSFSVIVGSPISENATFFVGLTTNIDAGGGIRYTFSSSSGSVGPGKSTLYLPAGTPINLVASPSSPLTMFTGWSGAVQSGEGTVSLSLSAPSSIHAGFAYNFETIAGIAGVVAVVAGAVVWRFRRSKT